MKSQQSYDTGTTNKLLVISVIIVHKHIYLTFYNYYTQFSDFNKFV